MSRALVITVRLHDDRYHGRPEWPPSPARLFQALVAASAKGGEIATSDVEALEWLEALDPPVISAPPVRAGQTITNYVPNNDLDSVGRNPRRVSEIRTGKSVQPRLLAGSAPLRFIWSFEQGEDHALTIAAIAEQLYQFGRGVDMAWASGDTINDDRVSANLASDGGVVHRPVKNGSGASLLCPEAGTLESLRARFTEVGKRFRTVKVGKRSEQQVHSQARRPRFRPVAYESPPLFLPFDLRVSGTTADFAFWPLLHAAELIERIRDRANAKLARAMPDEAPKIERVFIGRNATEADKASRIRIIPLPSIGHPDVVPAIRRVVVEVSPNCPLKAGDLGWAFSGLEVAVDEATGEILSELVVADDDAMLRHYGVGGDKCRVWRTITPAALPERAARRRIDPARLARERRVGTYGENAEAKSAAGRVAEEARAKAAIVQALRHAGIDALAEAITVQREPFDKRGSRAEEFAAGTRFAKERLWHAKITFAEPVTGPLVIGDGRYLGLGLMAPVQHTSRDTLIFPVSAAAKLATGDASAFLKAVRRALMALAREPSRDIPVLFSGHAPDGGPAASGKHEHVFVAADDTNGDGLIDRLVIAAPWACDRTARANRSQRSRFDDVVAQLESVRAGRLGVIELGHPSAPEAGDPLVGPSRVWESRTPYLATRRAGRRKDAKDVLILDLITECQRRGLPRPSVELVRSDVGPKGVLSGRAILRFAVGVHGPLFLGKDSHAGGGVFATSR